jgi:hypothetical protein
MFLNIDDRYNPINTPGDSQISVSTQYEQGASSIVFTVLPVSHTLSDDNRSYPNESSLQLLGTSLKIPLNSGHPSIEQLTFFDMESLIPYDEFTGGTSSHFHIAIEPELDSRLEVNHATAIHGAIGLTKRIGQDIDLYSLGGVGAGYTDHGYLFTTVEAGAVIREIWSMKTLFSFTRTDNQVDAGSDYYTIFFNQSEFVNKTYTLNIECKLDFNNKFDRHYIAISLKNIF